MININIYNDSCFHCTPTLCLFQLLLLCDENYIIKNDLMFQSVGKTLLEVVEESRDKDDIKALSHYSEIEVGYYDMLR